MPNQGEKLGASARANLVNRFTVEGYFTMVRFGNARYSVDLPAPLTPTRAVMVPGVMVKLIS